MHVPLSYGKHKLHDSIDELEASVRARCHFCTLVWQTLFEDGKKLIPSKDDKSQKVKDPVLIEIKRDEKRLYLEINYGGSRKTLYLSSTDSILGGSRLARLVEE